MSRSEAPAQAWSGSSRKRRHCRDNPKRELWFARAQPFSPRSSPSGSCWVALIGAALLGSYFIGLVAG